MRADTDDCKSLLLARLRLDPTLPEHIHRRQLVGFPLCSEKQTLLIND